MSNMLNTTLKTSYFFLQGFDLQIDTLNYDFELQHAWSQSLIEVDSDIKLPEEQEGHEFGYIPFEQLPPAQVEILEEILVNEVTDSQVTTQHDTLIQKNIDIDLPLANQCCNNTMSFNIKTAN